MKVRDDVRLLFSLELCVRFHVPLDFRIFPGFSKVLVYSLKCTELHKGIIVNDPKLDIPNVIQGQI